MTEEPQRPQPSRQDDDAERQADNTIGFRNVDEEAGHDEAPGPQRGDRTPPPDRPGH